MSYPVVIKPVAEADIQEGISWYEQQRAGLGEEFLSAVENALDHIAENPLLSPVVHRDIRRALTRRFPYALLYMIEDEMVFLLGVFHTSRDPTRWLERR